MTDIFVSYAREDRDRIEQLVRLLEERGWSVWWDRTIASGGDFADTIEPAIEEARCGVVAWSRPPAADPWLPPSADGGPRRLERQTDGGE